VIKSIKAEGYKSIKKLELELGRVNVFIGENGAGKSNILEVFALAGAAIARKLDNEFLSSRGIRVTEPEYMRPAFMGAKPSQSIEISMIGDGSDCFSINLNNDNEPYSKWTAVVTEAEHSEENNFIFNLNVNELPSNRIDIDNNAVGEKYAHLGEQIQKVLQGVVNDLNLNIKIQEINFGSKLKTRFCYDVGNIIVFSPENSALKIFQREGQIEPLGINGEGLLKLLSVLSREEHSEALQEIKSSLKVLGWFEDFALVDGDTISPRRITIKDRYIEENKRYFDQMSANEGFLFLLFYFSLFSTDLTPKIFAIDNIDASLNPKLCEKLLRELTRLAKKHDKQVLLTTHNPATLDGLNLDDDEQRLFVVSRGQSGETRVRRLRTKPRSLDKDKPVRLSEMFLKGSLGGLSKGF
jgi:AAA15 family ATPase/GTPase